MKKHTVMVLLSGLTILFGTIVAQVAAQDESDTLDTTEQSDEIVSSSDLGGPLEQEEVEEDMQQADLGPKTCAPWYRTGECWWDPIAGGEWCRWERWCCKGLLCAVCWYERTIRRQ